MAFWIPNWTTAELEQLDPVRDWRLLMNSGDDWITQTYLHLRDAGYPVVAVHSPPADGTVVVHIRRFEEITHASPPPRLRIVSVRAEVLPARRDADWEIVQNAAAARRRRTSFIPVWPQACLIPRDLDRDPTVQRIGYKGFAQNLHPYFRSDVWADELEKRKIEWRPEFWDDLDPPEWQDFSDLDLILAVRPSLRRRYRNKPASKLVNAWLAGVPAIAGREHPFRELRRSGDDYIEISRPEQALSAIDALRSDSDRYGRAVAAGLERGTQFSTSAVVERWIEVLEIVGSAKRPSARMWEIQRRYYASARRSRLAASRARRRLARLR